MRAKTSIFRLGLVAVVGLTAACEDGGTDPEAIDPALLVALADQALADAEGDVDHARAPRIPGLRFPARIPGIGDGDRPDCPQENGTYVCTRDGITTTIEVTFFDAGGNVQQAYDEATTASVTIYSEMAGSREGGRFSGSVDRTRDMVVTGLAGEETERVWNGTTEGTSTRTHLQGPFAGEDVTSTSTSSVEGLTLPLPSEDEPRWPLAGTITTEMSVSGGPRAGDHRVTIEFDGTQFATVTIDGETMTVDLEERRKGRHHGFGPRSGQGG